MNADEPHIDNTLVRHMVSTQFPHWAGLSVRPVPSGGWCNRAFHLGEQMIVRLPRHRVYAAQVAVIDFGNMGVGDPACDLAMTWTMFENESREAFRGMVSLD